MGLRLDGALDITGGEGESIALVGEGSRLRAEIGSLSTGRPTLRLVRSGMLLARRLAKLFARCDLTLSITRFGVPQIELGARARGGLAERLCGMSRVRLFRRT